MVNYQSKNRTIAKLRNLIKTFNVELYIVILGLMLNIFLFQDFVRAEKSILLLATININSINMKSYNLQNIVNKLIYKYL